MIASASAKENTSPTLAVVIVADQIPIMVRRFPPTPRAVELMANSRPPQTTLARPDGERFRVGVRVVILGTLIGLTLWRGLDRPAWREARVAFDRGDYPTALRRALDDHSRHARSRDSTLLAARSLSRMRYADEAEPLYHQALRGQPPDLETARDRALGLFESARFDRAVIAFRTLLDRYPDDATSLRYLASLELTHGRMAEALAAAERLARTPEGHGVGLAMIRDIHHEAKRPAQAVEAGERLLAFDPELKSLRYDRVLFWIEMASDLLVTHHPEKARDLLEPVVARSPDARLLDLLAAAHKRLGEMDQAEQRWNQATAVDPQWSNPWLQLGLIAMSRKQYPEAVTRFEKSAARNPEALDPAYNLALAYRALGRTADASRMDQKVEAIRSNSPTPAGGMGSPP